MTAPGMSTPRSIPPLNALRAFEAAGRHLSFTRAADELHVTSAAVGQQVRSLEALLGVQLFLRHNRSLVLTEAGLALLPGLSDVFYRLVEVLEAFRRRDLDRPLTVTVPPTFAAGWLLPRLDGFRSAHPDVEVRIDASNRVVDLVHEDADVALRYGSGDYPGMHVELLLREEVFPVCAPSLLEGEHPLRTPEDLRHHALLHVDDVARLGDYWPDWEMWLRTADVEHLNSRRGLRFSDTGLAIRMAAEGKGVAMGSRVLAASELRTGRLVQPFAPSMPTTFAYYVVSPQAIADTPRVAAFRQWVLAEAGSDPLQG
jgi:LysR family glycine cleavage system transcriptional activator